MKTMAHEEDQEDHDDHKKIMRINSLIMINKLWGASLLDLGHIDRKQPGFDSTT